MIQGVEDQMRLRLDALEARGQHVLGQRQRNAAWDRAIVWTARSWIVGAAAVLLLSLWMRLPFAVILLVVMTPPLVTVGAAYGMARRRGAVARSQALALVDHRFQLKDRLQTADEFGQVAHRSPFQEAALQEAAPWLERAANAAVDPGPPLSRPRVRLLIWPVAALCLLVLALVVPRWASSHPSIARSGAVSEAGLASEVSAAGSKPAEAALAGSATGIERGVGRTDAQAAKSQGQGLTGVLHKLASLLQPDRGPAGGRRDKAQGQDASGAASASGGAGAGQGSKGAAGRGASQSAGGQAGEERQAPLDASTAGKAGDQDDAAATTPGQNSSTPGGRQDAPSARQSDPQRAQPDASQSGEGQQPGGRSRRADQSGNGREQGGGEGEAGQRSGQDAGAKKGRGVSSLLLATPMQDRLTGMASPGRITTTTREGAPQGFPVASGQAADRGMARGEAGRTGVRTTTPQDQRLTRDYFTDRNGGGR